MNGGQTTDAFTMTRYLLFAVTSTLLVAAAGAGELKLATVLPENSQWMRDMRAAAAAIQTQSQGRVILKLYGGGVMGNEKKVLRKIRAGQLQGGAFTANGIAEVYPDIVVYGLPMVFESQDEVDYVRQRMDKLLMRGLEQAGFVSFGFAGGGFARIFANKPISRVAELQGQKVWVPDGDRVTYAAMEALQLSPVVLPVTDVLTGLQTGLIDIIAAPPVGVLALQWQTRVKYQTTVPLMYTMGLVAIDGKAFAGLAPPDQAIVRKVMGDMYSREEQQSRQDDMQAQKALQGGGLRFVDADPADVLVWRRTIAATNQKLGRDGVFSPSLLDQLNGLLQEFRARMPMSVSGPASRQ
jgi:TRAP-type C4-dicarboxylate transport system substrate-binding protein